jgi:integrase
MSNFALTLGKVIESYIDLRCTLGCTFRKQAATLHAFGQYVEAGQHDGPLTQDLALEFVMSRGGTTTGRARRYGVLRRFADYLSVFDTNTQILDPRALPSTRAVPPPRIPSDEELGRLMFATRNISPDRPLRGQTLMTLVGLLASTGLRSGEALRLDRADVDLGEGVLQVRRTKFRKDRLVPLHATALAALRAYARARDTAFAQPQCPAFFVSTRGCRLSKAALYTAFHKACSLAGLDDGRCRSLRPHDMRHRFATARLAAWHRESRDVQVLLPLLATYLGHVRYNDTAYYITGTAELLGLAAARAFTDEGGVS